MGVGERTAHRGPVPPPAPVAARSAGAVRPDDPAVPRVHLVHGAGLDGASFAAVARRLGSHGIEPVIVTRRGYDGRAPTADLHLHVADLEDLIGAGPALVVGVSGGATLALELALRNRAAVRRVVAHEPLLGPMVADQHTVISASVQALLDEPDPDAVDRFVARLVTRPLWAALPPDMRHQVRGRAATVRCEAAGFARFAVTAARLAALVTPLTWTVGRRSPPWRHRAAETAAALAPGDGLAVRPVPGIHTPQLECPEHFADLIVEEATR